MKTKTQKIVLAALMAALVCIATMIIKIPTPMKGYMNIGDGIVLLCGWLLSPAYGFLAAAIGSLFADVLSGYAFYAPVTFIIKGTMAYIAWLGGRRMQKNKFTSFLISGICAEIFMICGYYIYEGFLYGFGPAALNIPLNGFQGLCAVIIAMILINVFNRYKIKK